MPNVIRAMVRAKMISHDEVLALAKAYLDREKQPKPPLPPISFVHLPDAERRTLLSGVQKATELGLLYEREDQQYSKMHRFNPAWATRVAAYVRYSEMGKPEKPARRR